MKVRAKQQARTTVYYDRQLTQYQNPLQYSPDDKKSHIQFLEDQPISYNNQTNFPNNLKRFWRKKIFEKKARSQLPVSAAIPQQNSNNLFQAGQPQFILEDFNSNPNQAQGNNNIQDHYKPVTHQLPPNNLNYVQKERVDQMEDSFNRNKRLQSEKQNQIDRRVSQIQQQIKYLSQQYHDKADQDAQFQNHMVSIMRRKDQALFAKQQQINHNLKHIMDMQDNEKYYKNEIQNLKNQIAHEKKISELSKENEKLYQKILNRKPNVKYQNNNRIQNLIKPSQLKNQFSPKANKNQRPINDKNTTININTNSNRQIPLTKLSPQKVFLKPMSMSFKNQQDEGYNLTAMSPFSINHKKN